MRTIYKPFGLTGRVLEYILDAYTVQEPDHTRFHYDPRIADIFCQVTVSFSGMLSYLQEWKDLDLSPVWQKIDPSLPILIIHGANSDILSTATIEQMKKGREESTHHFTVENVGHAPMLFSALEVERISSFLK